MVAGHMNEEAIRMTVGGWVFMAGAWAGVLTLLVFCLVNVFRSDNGAAKVDDEEMTLDG